MTDNAKLYDIIRPAVQAAGYELWGVEYLPQGKYSILRVYIDKSGGVTADDCFVAGKQVGAILDVESPIRGSYNLEVSSPGIERPLFRLEQYQQYIGQTIKIRLHQPVDERRKLTGVLQTIEDAILVILEDGQEYRVALDNIDRANVVTLT